jgi:hypothetical protein
MGRFLIFEETFLCVSMSRKLIRRFQLWLLTCLSKAKYLVV